MAIRPRRSALYMPGSNARALEKAKTLAADVVIFDLEDAVAPEAKDAARDAAEVQSLDRVELADALHRRLQNEGRTLDVLVQVKTSSEPSKFGMEPEEVGPFLRRIASEYPTLRVQGLMTLAVNSPDADEVRACFRALRELRDGLVQENIPGVALDRLSMGMSGDFELAIEEGSTEVRIGSAIFGARHYPDPQ